MMLDSKRSRYSLATYSEHRRGVKKSKGSYKREREGRRMRRRPE
jgi:hypothetical protein